MAELGGHCVHLRSLGSDALTVVAANRAVELVRGLAARGLRVGIVSNIGAEALAEG
jgi:hypothetical protein